MVNVFNLKEVSHWCPDMRVPKVLLLPPQKMDFWPQNGQIWPKTDIFGQISAFLVHMIPCRPKTMSRWFFHYVITETFTYSHKLGFLAPKRPNLAQNLLFSTYFNTLSFANTKYPRSKRKRKKKDISMVLIEGGYALTDLEPQLLLSDLLYNQKMFV